MLFVLGGEEGRRGKSGMGGRSGGGLSAHCGKLIGQVLRSILLGILQTCTGVFPPYAT